MKLRKINQQVVTYDLTKQDSIKKQSNSQQSRKQNTHYFRRKYKRSGSSRFINRLVQVIIWCALFTSLVWAALALGFWGLSIIKTASVDLSHAENMFSSTKQWVYQGNLCFGILFINISVLLIGVYIRIFTYINR